MISTLPRCWSSRLHAEPTPCQSIRQQVLYSLMISQRQIALWVSRAVALSASLSLCTLKLSDLVFPHMTSHDMSHMIPRDITWHHMISGVKQVPIEHLLEDKTYIFFSHTIKAQPENMPLLDAMLQKVKLMWRGRRKREGTIQEYEFWSYILQCNVVTVKLYKVAIVMVINIRARRYCGCFSRVSDIECR